MSCCRGRGPAPTTVAGWPHDGPVYLRRARRNSARLRSLRRDRHERDRRVDRRTRRGAQLCSPRRMGTLVFGGHQPALDENSPELRVVKTIFNRYNEVSGILADRPQAYRPIFMIDDDGSIVVRDWGVGFALGLGVRAKEG